MSNQIKSIYVIFFNIIIMLSSVALANDPVETSICACNRLDGVNTGDIVRVTGVCSVETERMGGMLTYISEPEGGPYCCGIAVYDRDQVLFADRGQCMTVIGILESYYGKMEINISEYSQSYPPIVWDCGWKLPDPERITSCGDFEPFMNCLVIAEGLTVTTEPDIYGNVNFTDKYGCEWPLLMRIIDPPIEPGTRICSITGLLDYHFEQFKLRPRDEFDYDFRNHDNCPWTGTTCDPISIRSYLNKTSPDCILAGEPFIHTMTWKNLCSERTIALIDVLDVAGAFFFWPSFFQSIDCKVIVMAELKSHWEEILRFEWPSTPGLCIYGTFWSAAFDPATMDFSGDIVPMDFCAGDFESQ